MKKQGRNNGVSFLSLLGLLFIGLKLTGQLDWPWWMVTLPLWGPVAMWLAFMAFWASIWLVANLIERHQRGG